MFRKMCSWMHGWWVAAAVVMVVFAVTGGSAQASEGESSILITEIVAKSAGEGQPYEYVEIYNDTSEAIDLTGYQLQYFTSDFTKPANRWPIPGQEIQPRESVVLWLKKFNHPDVPLWDFNSNYGVMLPQDQVAEIKLTTAGQGLHDSALRQVGIANAAGETIVTALVNEGTADGIINKSVIYQKSDGQQMTRIRNNETATPGSLVSGQVPGPETPVDVKAEALDGAVALSWNASAEAVSYHIYQKGAAGPTVVHGDTFYTAENLVNHQSYSFRVTAIDADGNESPASTAVQAVPQEVSDQEAPQAPAGLKAVPGADHVVLEWEQNPEEDLAGYKVYVDNVFYEKVAPDRTSITVLPLQIGKEYTFSVTAIDFAGNESDRAQILAGPSDNVPVPRILITEVVPDTDNYAKYDAFEYVEIYNNSNEAIDLKGYRIRSGSWNVEIQTNLVVEPWDTQLFWTRTQQIMPITLEAFNSAYFGSYKSKYLSEEKVHILNNIGGLVNSGNQSVVITDPRGSEVVRANYTGADVSLRKSVTFGFPAEGGLTMETLAGHQEPTPGWVDPAQVPERPQGDGQPPKTPVNVRAEAGSGTAELSWDPDHEAEIYRYHIYKDGGLEFSVKPDQHSFTLYTLIGNKTITLEVAAEDVYGNISEKSQPQSVTPTHQIITQEERSFVEKDPAYQGLWDISKDGPVIPGLAQDLIPQGITYYKQKDWILTVSYLDNGRPGTLTVVDATTEKLVKSVLLYNKDGSPYTGHAGGLTISKDHVWVASEEHLLPLRISDLVNAPNNGEIRFLHKIPVPIHAAYNVYDEGILWVGEFYEAKDYPTDPSHHMETRTGNMHHAWMIGFDLRPNTDMLTKEQWNEGSGLPAVPDYVFSTTDKVQGAIVQKKGITLSTSYGRGNDSVLYRYEHPLKEKAHDSVTIAGKTVPLWFLDGAQSKPRESIAAIPMPEGIVANHPKDLYVVFESGANKYRYTTTYPMDRMLNIDLKKLMKDDKDIIKEERK